MGQLSIEALRLAGYLRLNLRIKRYLMTALVGLDEGLRWEDC
jgi:hypothetical protein